MKKIITFTEEQVLQMKYMLNAVTISGIQNAKQVAAIAQVLESGMPGEVGTVDNTRACTAQNNASPARTGGEV